MTLPMNILAQRLSAIAESVCSHYLFNGRKNGRYWLVGDVHNTPGRSLFVRLAGPTSGKGAAGKWTDAATGQHGDLLDLIALNQNLATPQQLREEAMTFLSEPAHHVHRPRDPVPRNSSAAARRLFAASKPISGTLGDTYLRHRGITMPLKFPALRFHPGCYYKVADHAHPLRVPAIIAAVTDVRGDITGLQRIYLAPDGHAKADLPEPRLSMGDILGNAVRFGIPREVMAAGEGVETILALLSLMPDMPMAAALSASNLAALEIPPSLSRLYIALDNDYAGHAAAERLACRALDAGIEPFLLKPAADDWNTDLLRLDVPTLLASLALQLTPGDASCLGPC